MSDLISEGDKIMGREIRKVPPNWVHPTIEQYGRVDLKPMYNRTFEAEFSEWLDNFDRIRRGELNAIERECYMSPLPLAEWLKDEGVPPDPAYYRPWKDEEATWFQLWETVSEGTPVSPPFETAQALANYLAIHGDFWDQKRGNGGWGKKSAEAFVKAGWAPSLMISKGTILESKDIPAALSEGH